jgi:hypothetical protein
VLSLAVSPRSVKFVRGCILHSFFHPFINVQASFASRQRAWEASAEEAVLRTRSEASKRQSAIAQDLTDQVKKLQASHDAAVHAVRLHFEAKGH